MVWCGSFCSLYIAINLHFLHVILLLIKLMNIQTVLQSYTRLYCNGFAQEQVLLRDSDPAVEAYCNHLKSLADNKADSDMSGAWTSLHMNVAEKRA